MPYLDDIDPREAARQDRADSIRDQQQTRDDDEARHLTPGDPTGCCAQCGEHASFSALD